MAPRASGSNRVANRLVALSSAAVLTVYSAGYFRTKAAADRLQAADRSRVVIPTIPSATEPRPARASTPEPVAASPAAVAAPEAVKPRTEAKKAIVNKTPVATPTPTPGSPALVSTPAVTPQPVVVEPTPTPTAPHAAQYKDGTYSGWGTSRHGDIEVTVVIAAGRITSAVISQCWTRYSCSVVAHLQDQVVARQSAEVDYVSRATQSANAFYYGVLQALSKAK